VQTHLARCARRPRGTDNVLYPMHDALRGQGHHRRGCNTLREVWGVYVPPTLRDPVPFKTLAAAVGGLVP
jgi:hypothetical protein